VCSDRWYEAVRGVRSAFQRATQQAVTRYASHNDIPKKSRRKRSCSDYAKSEPDWRVDKWGGTLRCNKKTWITGARFGSNGFRAANCSRKVAALRRCELAATACVSWRTAHTSYSRACQYSQECYWRKGGDVSEGSSEAALNHIVGACPVQDTFLNDRGAALRLNAG
jgi:hypothetical protein